MKPKKEPGDALAFRAVATRFYRETPLRRPGDSSSQMLVRDGLVAAAALADELMPDCFILKANR